MFTRYKINDRGRRVPVAKIYTSSEHNVSNSRIDKDALWVIRRIQASGEQAYIVGGAVRDLLLGKRPKDFDIATSASPRQLQRLFWNSRSIGRRFRIVHIFFGSKIIEVTTFRSDEENFEEGHNNVFGTIEQDSKRRDFSINALYYNPSDGHLVDFNDSLDDYKKKVIRSLIPLKYSFSEDPVRMIRALKYMCTTGFRLKTDVKLAIRRNASNLQGVSTSRITEEMSKIFLTGRSADIIKALYEYKLMGFLMPCWSQYVNSSSLIASLEELDEKIKESRESGKSVGGNDVLFHMMKPLMVLPDGEVDSEELKRDFFRQIKVMIAPLTPPNYEIERASEALLVEFGYKSKSIKKRASKKPAERKTATVRAKKSKGVGEKNVKVSNVRKTGQEEPSSAAEAHDL